MTVNVCYFSDDIFSNIKMGYLEQQEGPETHESTLRSNLDSARRAPEIFEDWAFHCYGLISFCEWVSPPAASYVTLEPKSIAAALTPAGQVARRTSYEGNEWNKYQWILKVYFFRTFLDPFVQVFYSRTCKIPDQKRVPGTSRKTNFANCRERKQVKNDTARSICGTHIHHTYIIHITNMDFLRTSTQ